MKGVEYLLYVPHHDVERRKREGWIIADDFRDIHHGNYAVLMKHQTPEQSIVREWMAAAAAIAAFCLTLWCVLAGFQRVFGP